MNHIRQKTIFISALDWGLGHLTRTAAIIQQLKEHNQIVIFTTPSQSSVYSALFPDLQQVPVHSYQINFHPQQFFKNIILTKKIFSSIQVEHNNLKKFISSYQSPDIIISDNRYGFYSKNIPSVLISHQLEIQLPFLFSFGNIIQQNMFSNFDEIWVPDYPDKEKSLTGKLSHNSYSLKHYDKIKYIYPQSLMTKNEFRKEIDYLFIISGTNAERNFYENYFENISEKLLKINSELIIKIAGSVCKDNRLFLGLINYNELNNWILKAKNIITRPGYSTLMDLHKIMSEDQNLYLIQPRYQYEQKYLYEYWIQKQWAQPLSVILQ
ncbi:MAG: hypothetical protein N2203_06400 [Bacteroidia bacterium]|nr:hypothetical protein [Bacteroidia bacterium]